MDYIMMGRPVGISLHFLFGGKSMVVADRVFENVCTKQSWCGGRADAETLVDFFLVGGVEKLILRG